MVCLFLLASASKKLDKKKWHLFNMDAVFFLAGTFFERNPIYKAE